MGIDIKRLKHDTEYWDEVSPEGATHIAWLNHGWTWWKPAESKCGMLWHKRLSEWQERYDELVSKHPRPTKPSASEWDGSDRPPIGIWVEHNKHGHFTTTRIIGYDGSLPICTHGEGKYYGVPSSCMRPIRTKEQREREELRRELMKTIDQSPINPHGFASMVNIDSAADAILERYELKERDK